MSYPFANDIDLLELLSGNFMSNPLWMNCVRPVQPDELQTGCKDYILPSCPVLSWLLTTPVGSNRIQCNVLSLMLAKLQAQKNLNRQILKISGEPLLDISALKPNLSPDPNIKKSKNKPKSIRVRKSQRNERAKNINAGRQMDSIVVEGSDNDEPVFPKKVKKSETPHEVANQLDPVISTAPSNSKDSIGAETIFALDDCQQLKADDCYFDIGSDLEFCTFTSGFSDGDSTPIENKSETRPICIDDSKTQYSRSKKPMHGNKDSDVLTYEDLSDLIDDELFDNQNGAKGIKPNCNQKRGVNKELKL